MELEKNKGSGDGIMQSVEMSIPRLCQRIPLSPLESTWATLLKSLFLLRMGHVVSIETVGIAAGGGCFLEWDAMFLEGGNDLRE